MRECMIAQLMSLVENAIQHFRRALNTVSHDKKNGTRLIFLQEVENGRRCDRMRTIVEREENSVTSSRSELPSTELAGNGQLGSSFEGLNHHCAYYGIPRTIRGPRKFAI